ncbi:hypothetical protein RB195_005067 [Necator americanus]|uniref:PB1 domain-containing protein n=1 Tax=Necator americanus TaxID=51031 RepID=A0ABR1BMW6_NECAM
MTDEEKTVTIKLYCSNEPRMVISYKDKKDLFEQYQKKMKRLGIPTDDVYWADWDSDRYKVRTASDLLRAVEHCTPTKLHIPGNYDDDGWPISDEEDEEEEREEGKEERKKRNRSRSGHQHKSPFIKGPLDCDHMPWDFVPWNFAMDPRYGYGPASFNYDPPTEKSRRSLHERRNRYCCCNGRKFENL